MPLNSLMLPFTAIANSDDQLNISPGELESAAWFSRDQVKEAMERTTSDPYLKTALKLSQDIKVGKEQNIDSNSLRYIPPQGAIAHSVIRLWIDRKC
jgi:NADH pyrophosphatase NudC (nudix superfamily)